MVLNVSASASVSVGTYQVTMRAAPGALSSTATIVTSLSVVVRPASSSNGNVLLDWSACDPPLWLAGQDGTGAWQRLQSVTGTFRFSVTTGRGGFAFVTGVEPLAVRYMTQSELTDRPIDMCPPNVPTKVVRGRGEHLGANQTWFYALGGGTASSTNFAPDFSIAGVRYGEQDLFGWTLFGTGYRGVVRRNVDIPDGQSLPESVNLLGPEAFAAAREAFTISGVVGSGESPKHTMNYLTGSASISNALYTSTAHGFGPAVFGVPPEQQESDDFHYLTVISAGSSSLRSTSVSFRAFQARTLALPPVIATPVLVQLSAPYKRLQASLGVLPAAYNGSVEFRYSDGRRSMSVTASNGYLGTGSAVLAVPDLSPVSEFSSPTVIPAAIGVSWSITLEGSADATSLCTEGRTSVQLRRSGVF